MIKSGAPIELRTWAGNTELRKVLTGPERAYLMRYMTEAELLEFWRIVAPSRWDQLRFVIAPSVAKWAAACDLWMQAFYAPSGPPPDAEERLERQGWVWQAGSWRWLRATA